MDEKPDPEFRKRRGICILQYLSMPVPRSWWQRALETGSVSESYVGIMSDLCQILLEVPQLGGKIDYSLLVALAFADDDQKEAEWRWGTVHSGRTLEEFLSRGRVVLSEHPELRRLGEFIGDKAKALRRPRMGMLSCF